MKRAFVIVIDACGAGELPDSAGYGDAGTNTLGHVAEAAGGLDLPVLQGLGLGDIMPLVGVPPSPDRVVHGRLHPLAPGKDTGATRRSCPRGQQQCSRIQAVAPPRD